MQLFGESKSFAISCRIPGLIPEGDQVLIYCHLMLNGCLIGNIGEADLLGTCAGDLKRMRDKVKSKKVSLENALFASLNETEILEQVYKSNQLKHEFDPAFSHLPELATNELWLTHRIQLAESTDGYDIIVIEQAGKLKFIWRNCRSKETDVHFTYTDHATLIEAIDSCLKYLKTSYPERLSWLVL